MRIPLLDCSRLAETIDRFRPSVVPNGHHCRGEGRTPAGAVYDSLQLEEPTGRRHAI